MKNVDTLMGSCFDGSFPCLCFGALFNDDAAVTCSDKNCFCFSSNAAIFLIAAPAVLCDRDIFAK